MNHCPSDWMPACAGMTVDPPRTIAAGALGRIVDPVPGVGGGHHWEIVKPLR